MATRDRQWGSMAARLAAVQLALVPSLTLGQTGVFGQGALTFNPFTVGTNPEGRTYTLTPGLRASVTASDNIDTLPKGLEQAGQLYEVTPYLRGSLNGTNAAGAAWLSVRGQYRNGGIADGTTDARATLFSWGNLRLVDDLAGVYARVNVFDVNRSPFAASSFNPSAQTTNRAQYRELELSPYLYGRFQGDGNWFARYMFGYQDPGGGLQSSVIQSVIAQGRSDLTNHRVGFSTRAQLYGVQFEENYNYRGSEIDLLGWYRVNSTLRAGAGVGYASNSVLLNDEGESSGWGPSASVEWTPFAQTFLRGYWSERYYGRNASLQAGHQISNFALGISYRTGITAGAGANLYSANSASMFSAPSSEGSPAATPLGPVGQTLANQNLLPLVGSPLGTGLIDSALVYADFLVATVGWSQQRNSVFATAFVNNRRTAVALPGTSSFDTDQHGGTLTYRRQLSPRDSTWITLAESRTSDNNGPSRSNVSSVTISFDHRLGPRTTAAVGGRAQRQNGTGGAVSYDEAAVFAWLDYLF